MLDHPHLIPSCRVALAALLHDLGKFAERAGLEVDSQTLEANQHLYCPRQGMGKQTRFSHHHAAYTGLAVDQIEPWLPPMTGDDMTPFAGWNTAGVDDSLINAAAQHHSPRTFLQWVIATADRVASGFEREKFDRYNEAQEQTSTGKTHYTARQLTLFEQIRLDRTDNPAYAWRYPLTPLSPKSIFPVKAVGYELNDKTKAQAEYLELWKEFIAGLQRIPESHRSQLPLWIDHFDSLWACFTHAIPSATAFGVRPEVSLYDHSKAVAALAVALWRYHQEGGDEPEAMARRMQSRADWDEEKFLLIQGDFQGIQDSIFASGGETQKQAAKLLRGRSFYVSLLTECAALRLLDELGLPSTSQVLNAAGKFLIVAANTPASHEAVARVRAELESWFLAHTYGQSGLGIATLPAGCHDFLPDAQGKRRFGDLMKRLFGELESAKLKRFDLCGAQPPKPLFAGFLDRFTLGDECQIDGRSPAEVTLDNGLKVSTLAADQIAVGRYLATYDRLLITRHSLNHHSLRLPVFGYSIQFTGDEEDSGKFGPEARSGNLRRAWDFSLPLGREEESVWHGYARRFINASVPRWEALPNEWEMGKYRGRDLEEESPERRAPKTFNHLACEDRTLDEKGRPVGITALMTLKGDVDNLGRIFQGGLKEMTFAKMAGLSRQMNAFFTLYLPWLCQSRYQNCYTVFAGGDDFFLIGPWKSQIALARELRARFGQYVAENPEVHFSAALSITKPGLPVRRLADLAEETLEKAKRHIPKDSKLPPKVLPKDSVGCFGETVFWTELDQLLEKCLPDLERQTQDLKLSTGYLYDLLRLTEMAAALEADMKRQEPISMSDKEKREIKIENALWRSRFAYQTRRLLERQPRLNDPERRRRQQGLAEVIVKQGIEKFKGAYRIALFAYLYENRD